MTTLLSSPDGHWILEAWDGTVPPPPRRRRDDALGGYWLVVARSSSSSSSPDERTTLSVTKDVELLLPAESRRRRRRRDGEDLQVFRLSRIRSSRTTDGTTPPWNNHHRPSAPNLTTPPGEESPGSVGTTLLYSDDVLLKIWEFRLAPGERCDFHRHFHPYFFLNLTESVTQELDRDGHLSRPGGG